ncbi:phenylalanine 4-monooxygenase [Alteromonas sp. C1M14]|uniref:phenylalanine 4-monooxygenase n=1 Tax=Alteromonas sp. C1M14 TaxID=2841567 RepID=UPI001C09CB9B|nr:phenylalanine 4-monooxygenase [Alteromonas sp. C1M14]MBU2978017.1 phenylalanine 4-monooxygenase [Alteromonas sp. C1M14]
MKSASVYHSKVPDKQGFIHWDAEENSTWETLTQRQEKLLPGRACEQYLHGLALLDLPTQRIPQLAEIDQVLMATTGWKTAPVPALIDFTTFFGLLANKQFPVATFIRSPADLDYLQEPDIFHEVFGHCPLLTNSAFAHFTHMYGKLGLAASQTDRRFLARLYWFTVEFGLLHTPKGFRIYGGGILSSPKETRHALDSEAAIRLPLNPLDALRTPYRIDIIQPLYYVLEDLDGLYQLAEADLMGWVNKAKQQGLHNPVFASSDEVTAKIVPR